VRLEEAWGEGSYSWAPRKSLETTTSLKRIFGRPQESRSSQKLHDDIRAISVLEKGSLSLDQSVLDRSSLGQLSLGQSSLESAHVVLEHIPIPLRQGRCISGVSK
jgi:hypothetical protein